MRRSAAPCTCDLRLLLLCLVVGLLPADNAAKLRLYAPDLIFIWLAGQSVGRNLRHCG